MLTILSGEQILNGNELMASTWSNSLLHFLSWRAASRFSCFLGLSQAKPELIYFSTKNYMSCTFSRNEHLLRLNFLGSIRPCTQAKYGLLPTSSQHVLGRDSMSGWEINKYFHVRLFIYLLVAALWSAQGAGMQVGCPRLVCMQGDGMWNGQTDLGYTHYSFCGLSHEMTYCDELFFLYTSVFSACTRH